MKTRNTILNLCACIVIALLGAHCKESVKGDFKITVAYKNLDKMISRDNPSGINPPVPASGKRILLEAIPFGGEMTPVILDSASLKSNNGEVVLKGSGKEEAIFQVVVENGPMLLLVNDDDDMKIDIDLSKKDNYYTVTGSEASAALKDFIRQYGEKTAVVNRSFASLDSIKQLGSSDSLSIIATNKKNKDLKEMNTYLQEFISNSVHPALSLFALGWASRSFSQAEFEKSLTEVVGKFPEHTMLKSLRTSYDLQKQQLADQDSRRQQNSFLGKAAPDLELPDTEGKMVSLSAMRGKFVLVDFWASWCGPCRQENPNVVKAYNQYKDKNFTILGVSLDKEKEPWLKAIKDDQLTWTHISDLKFWNSKAVDTYKFEGIPYNVLVDPNGNVIAENLRGFDLENKLAEVLNKEQ